MTVEKAVTRIAEHLVREAVRDGDRATWFGDDRVAGPSGDGAVVHRAVDGDLYGGTAGIGLFLARYAVHTGDAGAARTARQALTHAAGWVRRTRPRFALLSGAAGVCTALADAALLLGDDQLAATAARLTRDTLARTPAELDLTCGRAGTLLAQLHLARALAGIDTGAAAAAAAAAHDTARGLLGAARPGPAGGTCWPSDITGSGIPLCGLAHGASGVALALTEYAATGGPPQALRTAAAAAGFERTWYAAEHGNWPDLRHLGDRPGDPDAIGWPVYWCHGALGIGVARLRHHDLTGEPLFAAEAGVAVDAAVRSLTALADRPAAADLSVCHGACGAIELLLDAARILRQPALRAAAGEAAGIAVDLVGAGEWPCGVAGGGENPSLLLGLAGIGTTLLRTLDGSVPSTVLAYAGGAMSTRVIVQLSGPLSADDLPQRLDTLRGAVPDARVERVSPRGRALLRLAPGADAATAVAALNQVAGVEYAEIDVVDTAQDESAGPGTAG
jgi:lantibiotic modifying enzyme